MADFGYDVSNFREIDPIFGTMSDFDRLLRKAHSMGKEFKFADSFDFFISKRWFSKTYLHLLFIGFKVIMDYVPNHTSDQHEWFLKSIKRIPPYTEYYVWRDAKYVDGKRVPPNNWVCK